MYMHIHIPTPHLRPPTFQTSQSPGWVAPCVAHKVPQGSAIGRIGRCKKGKLDKSSLVGGFIHLEKYESQLG